METKYSEYYAKMLKAAQEYQDFVCGQLHAKGVVLQNMTSKKYQLKKENLLGLEIKFDDLIKKTNRVYIETAEKAHPRSGEYAKSGIYRDDDSWLYGIGNYEIFYIFDKKGLCRLDKANPNWLYRPPKDKPTSQGFCIPIYWAEKIAARTIRFNNVPNSQL